MFIITECPNHGTKETDDYRDAVIYIGTVLECAAARWSDSDVHAEWHYANGHDCWVCCGDMVIDPECIAD